MKIRPQFTLVLLIVLLSNPAFTQVNNDLMNIARITDGLKNKRISSFDQSGGNNDRFENIEDGETKTLFEVEGAGMINHIWITIIDK